MTTYQQLSPLPPDLTRAQLDRAGSPIEKMFFDAARDSWPADMLSRLTAQRPVVAGGYMFFADFAWEFEPGNPDTPRIIIELDGHATHSSPGAIAQDRRRQRYLEEMEPPWVIVRYGGSEVYHNAQAVATMALERIRLEVRRWAARQPWAQQTA